MLVISSVIASFRKSAGKQTSSLCESLLSAGFLMGRFDCDVTPYQDISKGYRAGTALYALERCFIRKAESKVKHLVST